MSERNPCTEAGCRGDCCRNMVFINLGNANAHNTWKNAIEAVSEQDARSRGNGVYYCSDDVYIIGPCPHLDEESGDCKIFGRPERPIECEKFEFMSLECCHARLTEGHVPVSGIEYYLEMPEVKRRMNALRNDYKPNSSEMP